MNAVRGESCHIYPFVELNKVYRDNISYKWTPFTDFNPGQYIHKMYLTYQDLFHVFIFQINERDPLQQTAQYKELKRTASEEETVKHTTTDQNRYFALYVISERMDAKGPATVGMGGRNTEIRGYKVAQILCYTFYSTATFNDIFNEIQETRIGGECFCFTKSFTRLARIKLIQCEDFNRARKKLHDKAVNVIKTKEDREKRKKLENDERERVRTRDVAKLRDYEDKLFRDLDRDRKRKERREDLARNIEKLDGRVRNLRRLRHPSSNLPTPVRDYTRKRHRHKHYRKTHRPYHRYIERGFR